MTPEEEKYAQYITTHKENVIAVWKQLQTHFTERPISPSHFMEIEQNVQNHDKSKWNEEEFDSYRAHFYPALNETELDGAFNKAWLHHIHSNPHHWNHWVLWEPNGRSKALEMPFIHVIEMLCDWSAMSVAFGDSPSNYFKSKQYEMKLHKDTIECINHWLPIFDTVVAEVSLGTKRKL